ncbi:MAG: hypothetical protein VYA30_09750 [Myxococcota bacterium]|nr:hypothetical protein [Myxococcota bacterium]
MKSITLIASLLLLCACGSDNQTSLSDSRSKNIPGAAHTSALTLTPSLEVSGVTDVFSVLNVTSLKFDAELYVLPVESNRFFGGDAVDILFELDANGQTTITPSRELILGESGAYRVLLRVRQSDNGHSLDLGGMLSGPIVWQINETFREPAPTAASGNKMDMEPAPTAADEKCEPAPTAASDGRQDGSGDDPETDCEPAPTAADGEDEGTTLEPAPTAARDDDESDMASEAAPTAAEPAPTAARTKKATIETFEVDSNGEDDATLTISSSQEFEFYAGIADIQASDSTLVIRWDVRQWLRALLSEPLGIDPVDASFTELEAPSQGQFVDSPNAFELETF